MTGGIVNYFTVLPFMREWCKQEYAFTSQHEVENCALAHLNKIDQSFQDHGQAFHDFSDMHGSRMYDKWMRVVSSAILAVGLLLWLFKVELNQTYVYALILLANLALSYHYLHEVSFRYGVDYVAYLQQAGAVLNGERDYTRLSSHQGPCYYPAGHILHYMPAFMLHMRTENAETIIKAVHMVMHSVTLISASRLGYLYHQTDPKRLTSRSAQLLTFVLLANQQDRELNRMMFNDQIMIMYLLVALNFFLSH